MFHRLNSPSFLIIASVAFMTLGCEKSPDSAAVNPANSETTSQSPIAGTASDDVEDTTGQSDVAICRLEQIGGSGVTGTVNFTQLGDKVTVTGEVKGLKPGKHGFHVHESGDLSDKETGKSAGGHFNPTGQKHGKPTDAERHLGDLGNITADDQGVAKIEITDNVISLRGPNSIVGKSIVVHVGDDKFTQPTGDAGARAAFGLIEKKVAP